jgi:hypothetical protein
MPNSYVCRWCQSSFTTSKALCCHITNKRTCALRWAEFINSLAPPSEEMDLDATPQIDPEAHAEVQDLQDFFEDLPPIREHLEIDPSQPIDSHSQDGEDEDLFEVLFEGAGEIRGKSSPPFDIYMTDQRDNGSNIYYPFSGAREWELVMWLHETRMSLTKIDAFLRLSYVRICLNLKTSFSSKFKVQSRAPSFKSGAALRDRIAQISFPGPRWKAQTIVPPDGTPSEAVELFYRDPMEAIRYMLSRPALAEHLTFTPKRVYMHENSNDRVYSEMSTGDWWWRTQVSCFRTST